MSIKKKNPQDPHQDREAQKYERPIVSREFIMEFLAGQPGPLKFKEMAAALEIEDERDLDALRRRLKAMLRDGQVVKNRRGGFGAAEKMDMKTGRVTAHRDGFGFFIPDDASGDMYLSPRQMNTVMHGDRVLARVAGQDRRGRMEGQIVEVLEHTTTQVVGRFYHESGVGFVEPSDMRMQKVIVPESAQGEAKHGQIVAVRIVEQPNARSQPVGEVIEILGDHMAPGMEIEVAIRSYELPHIWPERVEQEAENFGDEVPEKMFKNREDLRETLLVTIDGEDAMDFDDAVYCEKHKDGWRLIVAIADVSTYVKPGTALDQEAYVRGNSVYFPGRVIPMLPHVLSNGLCSLNPAQNRLCLCCEMIIAGTGETKSFHFYSGVMRSAARLTYTVVGDALNGVIEARHRIEHVWPQVEELHRLYLVLAKLRAKRGAIDFETVETRIVFGTAKKIEQIVPVIRNDAHRLIEEFMIAANVCAAKFLLNKHSPGLYRVHEGPATEDLEDLRSFLEEFGVKLGGGDQPQAKHYAQVLQQVQGRPEARLIQTVLLRSMSQAVYSADNLGHFGLAFDAYTHFTSPIRRYPDLLVHRAIYHLLEHKTPEGLPFTAADLQQFGQHCSTTERRADDATRDAVSWLKCEYMLDKVGQVFSGIIVSVTTFGFFVELDDIFVEGLVHVADLDNDYYHFDPIGYRLTGERSGMQYRIGDAVRVKLARVSLDDRKMDFLVEALAPSQSKPKAKSKAKPNNKTKAKSKARSNKSSRRGKKRKE